MKKWTKRHQSSTNNMKAKKAKLITNNLILKIKNTYQDKDS